MPKTKQSFLSLGSILVEDRIRLDLGKEKEGRESIESLTASIKEHGLLQPLVVVEETEGYRLLAGGRRYTACKNLGWTEVPCHIFPLGTTAVESKIIELIENYDRKDLTFQEEASARAQIHALMIEQHGALPRGLPKTKNDGTPDTRWSSSDTAKLLGVDQRTITRDVELTKAIEVFPTELGQAKTKKEALARLDRIKAESGAPVTSEDEESPETQKLRETILSKLWKHQSWKDKRDELANKAPGFLILLKKPTKAELNEYLSILAPNAWILCTEPVDRWKTCFWMWPSASYTEPQTLQPNYRQMSYLLKGKAVLNKVGHSAIFQSKRVPQNLKVSETELPIDLWAEIIETFCSNTMLAFAPDCAEGNMLLGAMNIGVGIFGFSTDEDMFETYRKKVETFAPGHYTSFPGSLTGKANELEEL